MLSFENVLHRSVALSIVGAMLIFPFRLVCQNSYTAILELTGEEYFTQALLNP